MDAALVNYWQDLTRNFPAALASAHDRQLQHGLAGRDDCSMEDKGLLEDMRFHMESLTIWSQSSWLQIFSALSSSHSHLFMYLSILPLRRSKSPMSPTESWNKQPATGITYRHIKTAMKTARGQRRRHAAAASQISHDSIVMKTDKTMCFKKKAKPNLFSNKCSSNYSRLFPSFFFPFTKLRHLSCNMNTSPLGSCIIGPNETFIQQTSCSILEIANTATKIKQSAKLET